MWNELYVSAVNEYHLRLVSLNLGTTPTVNDQIDTKGTYLILEAKEGALNRRRQLKERGIYSHIKL